VAKRTRAGARGVRLGAGAADLRARSRATHRGLILDAARVLFRERGVEAVTMADVAEHAKVARATVFNHFGSKYALVEAITEEVHAYYRLMIENALSEVDTPVPVLVRSLFDLMGFGIEEDRRFYRGVFREIAKIQVGLDEGGAGERARQASQDLLSRLLERGQARRELRDDFRAAELASAFDSLSVGTINHWLYDDASEPLRARMQRAGEFFLAAAAVDPGAEHRGAAPDLLPPRTLFPAPRTRSRKRP
jgi:AcrR family transcriptional regulator